MSLLNRLGWCKWFRSSVAKSSCNQKRLLDDSSSHCPHHKWLIHSRSRSSDSHRLERGYEKVCLSTGLFAGPTHWKKMVYCLDAPLGVEKDEKVDRTVHFKVKGKGLPVGLFYETKDIAGHSRFKLYFSCHKSKWVTLTENHLPGKRVNEIVISWELDTAIPCHWMSDSPLLE